MSEFGPLSLHVPEPEVRPGDTPDFSKVVIPKAGSVPRPATVGKQLRATYLPST